MQNLKNYQNIAGFSKKQVFDQLSQISIAMTGLPSLLAYYPLNETSGNAINQAPSTKGSYNGTVSNATQGATGLVGKAYSFDGVGDRVIIPSIVPNAVFSFIFIFKRNGTPDANDRVIDQASGGPTRGWHVQLAANGLVSLKTWNNSGAQLSLDWGILQDNEFYVLGGSIGASSSVLYLNGVQVATGAGNSFGSGVVADLQFGCRSGGTSNPMSGSLQHVAIGSGVQWTAEQHAQVSNFFFSLNNSRIFRVDGVPYSIRGTNYSSNYLNGSSSNPWYEESGQLDYDLADIKEAGFNTVSIYADENNIALHLAALDKVAAAGLKAIVTRFITYGTDYSVATGGTNRTAAIAKFTGMITNLKDHEAIIAWGFANENNINLNTTSEADWYSLVDAACAAGKLIDSTRSIFTIDADLGTYPGDASLPNLDVLALNIYRGTTFTDLLQDLLIKTSKPTFLHEWGRSRTSNSASALATQASECAALIEEVESYVPFIAGHVHFKFTDSIAPGTVFGSTAPLAQGVNQPRTRYSLYDTLKDFLTTHVYP
jgi:hypothetical protein